MAGTTRVTIRVPSEAARRIEVRARMLGTSINAEYTQAVNDLVGTFTEWIELSVAQSDIVDWLDHDAVVNAQMSPIIVVWARIGNRPDGVTLAGRVLTLDRPWFRTQDAFLCACNAVAASGAEVLASSPDAIWPGRPFGQDTSVTYGWRGVPGRERSSLRRP